MISVQWTTITCSEYSSAEYNDVRYHVALQDYEEKKEEWYRTRLLLTNDEDDQDWVILQSDCDLRNARR